jgi:ubiquitin carboxyl-terminal hydrolase 4/11/15
VISKSWLEQWKTHVGYDAIMKGEAPSGRKYGRSRPGEINKDIVAANYKEEYHTAPAGYEVLEFPLKPEMQPSKDFVLVS